MRIKMEGTRMLVEVNEPLEDVVKGLLLGMHEMYKEILSRDVSTGEAFEEVLTEGFPLVFELTKEDMDDIVQRMRKHYIEKMGGSNDDK